jgi:outer membrane protein assembly factor BamB
VNSRHLVPAAAVIVSILGTATSLPADDWPQFRGPNQSGVSAETGLARTWPPNGPRVLWSSPVGKGFGGAAIHGGEVFILDRDPPGQHATNPPPAAPRVTGEGSPGVDVLRCLDLTTGTQKWTFAYHARAPRGVDIRGSCTVPTADGDRVYTIGPCGDIHAVNRRTHRPDWSVRLMEDFRGLVSPDAEAAERTHSPATFMLDRRREPAIPRWGFTHNGVLHRDTLIVAPHAETAPLVAFERATGRIRWRVRAYLGRNWFSHVTPYLTSLGGQDQVILVANQHPARNPPAVVSSVDADSGEVLWKIRTRRAYNVPIPMPVKIADDRLFITGGYRLGCFVLLAARGPTGWSVEFPFADAALCTAHVQTPVFYQDHLYAQSYDGYHNTLQGGLTCLTPDGQLRWRTGPGTHFENGAFLIADGLLYVMHGASGTLTMAEASPAGYRELARAKVLDAQGGQVWAPMALSDGKLVVRDQTMLKSLDVRNP